MRHSRISEWRLHVCAHKTATTHMQYALAACRKELAERGVYFLSADDIRSTRFPPSTKQYGWRAKLKQGLSLRRMEDAIASLRSGQARIAISEENLIGISTGLITSPFYSDLESRLGPLGALCKRSELHVFLSVRNFHEIIAAAYAQILRTRVVPGGFDPIRKEMLDHPPSWTDLVTRLKRALPKAHIRVWTFEDYLNNEDAIKSEFCGIDVPKLRNMGVPERTRTPPEAAIAKIESLNPSLPLHDHLAAVARILDEDNGSEKYAPFSDLESSRLSEAYQSDLAQMRKQYPGILIGG
jgi:hypothetical protein